MIGLVSSKALISFGTSIIVVSSLPILVTEFKKILSPRTQIFGFLLLFIMPFISGLWSSNVSDWLASVQNKVLLPALAWSYYLAPKLDSKRFAYLNLFQFGLVLLASVYSLMSYILHIDQLSHDYLKAKTLTVLLSDDHVQFSLLVFITIVMMIKDWPRFKILFPKSVLMIIAIGILWLFIYLHLLGAKTGILLSYFGILVYWMYTSKWIYKVLALPTIAILLVLAYLLFPTFKNRFHYTLYDFNQYSHGQIINGLTDGARVLSWKAGIEIATAHPLIGVGYGDMNDVFMDWHQIHSIHLEKYNWLQPSNEWLMYLCGSGILGVLLLSIALWLIFSKSLCRNEILFKILFSAQVLMMWYEVNLTGHISIVIFVWSICWYQYAVMKVEDNKTAMLVPVN